MSDLYGTREAAAYLRASEASVRRWADSGLIPVLRVGLRRERRFALADLERVAKAGVRGLGGRPRTGDAILPASPGGAQLAVHDHLATFYDSDRGRLRLSVPFLRDGLLAGHRCFLVASQGVADQYLQALSRENGIDVDSAVDSGALVIRSTVGSSAREAVAAWEELWWQALGLGAIGMRVVGEMATYEIFSAVQEMFDYEVAYDSVAKRLPVVTLCQYDVRHFEGTTVMRAIQVHPDLFSRRIADYLF
jgi:transcriptional repressor of dcmA and dcmR